MQAKKKMMKRRNQKNNQRKDSITWGRIERARERLSLRGTTYLRRGEGKGFEKEVYSKDYC